MIATLEIKYSRGRDQYDNAPTQRSALNFDEFENNVLNDRSSRKGMAFICAPLTSSAHYEKPERYLGQNNWRLKNLVAPRAFLPFDFDGFVSPETFQEAVRYLQRYRGFGYTTASHKKEAPRARAILQASRPVSRDEGIVICHALQAEMQAKFGENAIKFDDSVYRGEQPIYTPLLMSEVFRFGGVPVDVNAVLSSAEN